jgi:small-conductance mechanosensitive channel
MKKAPIKPEEDLFGFVKPKEDPFKVGDIVEIKEIRALNGTVGIIVATQHEYTSVGTYAVRFFKGPHWGFNQDWFDLNYLNKLS